MLVVKGNPFSFSLSSPKNAKSDYRPSLLVLLTHKRPSLTKKVVLDSMGKTQFIPTRARIRSHKILATLNGARECSSQILPLNHKDNIYWLGLLLYSEVDLGLEPYPKQLSKQRGLPYEAHKNSKSAKKGK